MKPLIHSLLITCALSACARPDMRTDLGVGVYTHGLKINPDDVDAILVATLDELELYNAHYNAARLIRAADFDVVVQAEGPVECAGEEKAGCYHYDWNDKTITIIWAPCLAETMLAHEIVHWAKHEAGDDSHDHEPELFYCPGSAEVTARGLACRDACGNACPDTDYDMRRDTERYIDKGCKGY